MNVVVLISHPIRAFAATWWSMAPPWVPSGGASAGHMPCSCCAWEACEVCRWEGHMMNGTWINNLDMLLKNNKCGFIWIHFELMIDVYWCLFMSIHVYRSLWFIGFVLFCVFLATWVTSHSMAGLGMWLMTAWWLLLPDEHHHLHGGQCSNWEGR